MKKLDTRVQYTKKALKQALLKILEKKPIAKVSVKEVCEAAGLNRGTFYLHYREPNDVLREIENDFIRENLEFFMPYLNEQNNTNRLAGMFSCILQNKDICAILLGPHGAPQFLERIQLMVKNDVISCWQEEFPDYDREKLEFVYDFIFPSATRMIVRWAKDDSGLSPDELGKRLDRLGHYCHLAIREF